MSRRRQSYFTFSDRHVTKLNKQGDSWRSAREPWPAWAQVQIENELKGHKIPAIPSASELKKMVRMKRRASAPCLSAANESKNHKLARHSSCSARLPTMLEVTVSISPAVEAVASSLLSPRTIATSSKKDYRAMWRTMDDAVPGVVNFNKDKYCRNMLPKQTQQAHRRVSFGKEVTVIERDISTISPASSASREFSLDAFLSPNGSMSSTSLSFGTEDSKTGTKTGTKTDVKADATANSKANSNHETKNSNAGKDTKKHMRRKVLIHYNTPPKVDHTGKVPARPVLKHANIKQLPTNMLVEQDGANGKENAADKAKVGARPIKLIGTKKKKSKVVKVVAKIRRSLRI